MQPSAGATGRYAAFFVPLHVRVQKARRAQTDLIDGLNVATRDVTVQRAMLD